MVLLRHLGDEGLLSKLVVVLGDPLDLHPVELAGVPHGPSVEDHPAFRQALHDCRPPFVRGGCEHVVDHDRRDGVQVPVPIHRVVETAVVRGLEETHLRESFVKPLSPQASGLAGPVQRFGQAPARRSPR